MEHSLWDDIPLVAVASDGGNGDALEGTTIIEHEGEYVLLHASGREIARSKDRTLLEDYRDQRTSAKTAKDYDSSESGDGDLEHSTGSDACPAMHGETCDEPGHQAYADDNDEGEGRKAASKTAAQPSSVSDHTAEPDWDTSTASDLCKTCDWPVTKGPNGWTHDAKNPVQWSDKRKTAAKPKGNRAPEEPVHQPMRPMQQIRNSPSADQLKARKRLNRRTYSSSDVGSTDETTGGYRDSLRAGASLDRGDDVLLQGLPPVPGVSERAGGSLQSEAAGRAASEAASDRDALLQGAPLDFRHAVRQSLEWSAGVSGVCEGLLQDGTAQAAEVGLVSERRQGADARHTASQGVRPDAGAVAGDARLAGRGLRNLQATPGPDAFAGPRSRDGEGQGTALPLLQRRAGLGAGRPGFAPSDGRVPGSTPTPDVEARKQMSRKQATKESAMRTEAQILREMAVASLADQRTLAAELDGLRHQRAASLQADRDVDLADTIVRAHLTPVRVHAMHTTATDWVDTEEPQGDPTMAMKTEATLWFQRTSAEVRDDLDEFAIQAQGMATRLASRHGDQADAAFEAFIGHVDHLYRQASKIVASADECPACEGPRTGKCPERSDGEHPTDEEYEVEQAEMGNTDYKKNSSRRTALDADPSGQAESGLPTAEKNGDEDPYLSEDWSDDDTGVHPAMPGAGEKTSRRVLASDDEDDENGDRPCGCSKGDPHLDDCPTKRNSDSDPEDQDDWYEKNSSLSKQADSCGTCGDTIERDPAHEDPQTWHHDNGEKHDHEATPGGSKESSKTAYYTEGQQDECWKDGKKIQFFDGAWYHLNSDKPAESHDDVYPPTPREKAEADAAKNAVKTAGPSIDPNRDKSGDSAQGESGLDDVEVSDDKPMWDWELDRNKPGTGAADVKDAKNPNDHTSMLNKAAAFRARVQANLAKD